MGIQEDFLRNATDSLLGFQNWLVSGECGQHEEYSIEAIWAFGQISGQPVSAAKNFSSRPDSEVFDALASSIQELPKDGPADQTDLAALTMSNVEVAVVLTIGKSASGTPMVTVYYHQILDRPTAAALLQAGLNYRKTRMTGHAVS